MARQNNCLKRDRFVCQKRSRFRRSLPETPRRLPAALHKVPHCHDRRAGGLAGVTAGAFARHVARRCGQADRGMRTP
jgi:hypothetical protein